MVEYGQRQESTWCLATISSSSSLILPWQWTRTTPSTTWNPHPQIKCSSPSSSQDRQICLPFSATLTLPRFDITTCKNVTIFTLLDVELFPVLSSPALPRHVLCHVDAQKLLYNNLVNLTSNVRIPTLAFGRSIIVTAGPLTNQGSAKYVVLNDSARVVSLDLYGNANLVIPGIDRVRDDEKYKGLLNLVKRKAKKGKKLHKKSGGK